MTNNGDPIAPSRTRAGLQFLVSFGFARGLQFLAPIAVANLLTVGDYGVVELAHASATLLVAVATLGTNGVIPFVILQSGSRGTLGAVFGHQAAIAMACIAAALAAACWRSHASSLVLMALFTGVLALQGLWTYVLRSHGARSVALFVEASPFTLVALAALAAWLSTAALALTFIQAVLLLALCIMLALVLVGWRSETRKGPARYLETLRAGVPLMLGGMLSLTAYTSGRWGIGLLGGSELTGTYAAIARVAALPVVAHQLAVTAQFRDLFSLSPTKLHALQIRVALFVFAAVVVLLILIPWFGFLFGPAFKQAADAHQVATALLLAQVILWSGLAQNDLIASRHDLLPRLLPWTASALLLSMAAAAAVLLSQGVSVDSFAIWHTCVMAVLFAVQCGVMARMGVRFTRYWLVCAGTFTIAMMAGLAWLT